MVCGYNSSWQGRHNLKSIKLLAHVWADFEAEMGQELGPDYKSQRLPHTHTDPLPPVRSHTPKGSTTSQNNVTSWGPGIQTHDSMGCILHPNHNIASSSGTIPYRHMSMHGERDNSNQASSPLLFVSHVTHISTSICWTIHFISSC